MILLRRRTPTHSLIRSLIYALLSSRHGYRRHVPDFLPEYPDPHTFKQTPVYEALLADFETWRKRRSHIRDVARNNLTR